MSDHLDSLDVELNHSQFFRMFALGCFDSFITLPISITGTVGNIVSSSPKLVFYQGWTAMHSDWEPIFIPRSIWSTDKLFVFALHWDEWINPFFALVFFALFGLTLGARKGYCKFLCFLVRPFGVRQADHTEESLPDVVFNSGRGTDASATSNISSRYCLSVFSARKSLLTISCSSPPADVSVWILITDEPTSPQRGTLLWGAG